MIKAWKISKFKSISKDVTLDFAPLTILVGANSSGKSSIIQTILLVKQTLQYGPADRPLLLNGPLLRLGNFYDVKNALSAARSFSLSFIVEFQNDEHSTQPINAFYRKSKRLESVSCALTVGLDARKTADEINLLQPFLRSSRVSIIYYTQGDERQSISSYVNRARVRDANQDSIWDSEYDPHASHQVTSVRVMNATEQFKEELAQGRPDVRLHGAYPNYLFPTRFLVSYDESKHQSKLAGEQLIHPTSSMLRSTSLAWPRLLPIVKDESLKWLSENNEDTNLLSEVENSNSVSELALALYPVTHTSERTKGLLSAAMTIGSSRSSLSKEADALRDRVELRVRKELGTQRGLDIAGPAVLQQSADELKDFFISRVRYLGPLREAPKPLYPLEALADPTDVGYRGEHTAAVLDLNKNSEVNYLPPPRSGSSFSGEPIRASLQNAVVDWLSYMEIISGIETSDRGKFGRELQVRMADVPKKHDLTNVGVGVSQVLPIVVLCLLASRRSVIILEQPELHLHPLVQARLGDFLLSMSALDKQCLVGTHSGHLILRLRRRVAESNSQNDDKLASRIKLFYVERRSGRSAVREASISKFGALQNWPAGFLDSAQSEVERILMAGSQKRRAKHAIPSI